MAPAWEIVACLSLLPPRRWSVTSQPRRSTSTPARGHAQSLLLLPPTSLGKHAGTLLAVTSCST